MSVFETGAEEAAYDLGVQHGEEMGIVKGETQAEERIIKLLDGLMNFETDTQRRIDHKLALQVLKDALIKGQTK